MSNKMLIDASHPEETRVIVTRGNKIEEFDFESEHKKQLKGNIYLARVTRVEPSLQAAFVEYGGNRHGFLAFSEIHPDYYQIPVADRLALLEAEAKAARAEDDEDEPRAKSDRSERNDRARRNRRRGGRRDGQNGEAQANGADKDLPAAEPVGPGFADYVAGTPAAALTQKGDIISEALDNGDDDDVENEEDMVESVARKMLWKSFRPTPAPIAASIIFRKSSSAARFFWCRWSRKSAATRALLSPPIFRLPDVIRY